VSPKTKQQASLEFHLAGYARIGAARDPDGAVGIAGDVNAPAPVTVGGSTNVVSDRFIQLANPCMASVLRPAPSRTTATGLPPCRTLLKTST